MTIAGVIGTGIGRCEDKPCILVFTTSDAEHLRQKIPATVEGYPINIQNTGEIRALDKTDK